MALLNIRVINKIGYAIDLNFNFGICSNYHNIASIFLALLRCLEPCIDDFEHR